MRGILFVGMMASSRRVVTLLILATLIIPMTASEISPRNERGGMDAAGEWQTRNSLEIHDEWWQDWSRDANQDKIDDRLAWLLTQPTDVSSKWWKRADSGYARVFVDYDHHPSTADVEALEEFGVTVTMRPLYIDSLIATVPIDLIHSDSTLFELPGIVMLEDLGLAETHMNEAVPNMGVEQVWSQYGYDGTGVTIAVLDTGVRGDHEGLNDMDDELTVGCEQPEPDPLNPEPIFIDCDLKISAFYDAVVTDSEQPARESYDSGTHGSHVAGIAAGTGGGQEAPDGSRYIGVAPGAWVINILACCDGDIQDIIEGAQWAIENKDAKGIDILTSSLGEQQFEIHFDNDGSSAWSQQMDAVAASGIITFLSAGNEFGGATFAGCNTIDSPGDSNLPITVASLDKDLGLAIYSSRGYTSDGRVKPDVSTIGSNIMAPDAATSDGYTSKSGTSMATPLMAGIAALMVEANPDLTHEQVKDIIITDSIERELQLLDDPGFNDCSILENRPDNEFGYGQADPLLFVQSAGSIDSSLNVTMNIDTLQEIGNESRISGTSSGGDPGAGFVQIKVGGGDWQQATDISSAGDWSSWNVKLQPHIESGNSTMYSRLVINEDRMSPVDARRVILIDGQNNFSGTTSEGLPFGVYGFLLPLLSMIALLGLGLMDLRSRKKIE
jgi:subtilisin family serine protease